MATDPEQALLQKIAKCGTMRNDLRALITDVKKSINDNDKTLRAQLRVLLPSNLRSWAGYFHGVTRFKDPGVTVHFSEFSFDGLYILAEDDEGTRVTVEYTQPRPEPESDEKQPLTAEEEVQNQKARDLEKILNEPRAAQFRRCMGARRAAAKLLSEQ